MSTLWQLLICMLTLHTLKLRTVKAATTVSPEVPLNTSLDLRPDSFWTWLQGVIKPTSATTTTTTMPTLTSATTTTSTTMPAIPAAGECATCQCGRVTHYRIVGGQETEVNGYPWMAMLLSNNNFYCGASLINDRYVATAAHCVKGFSQGTMSVRLLEHDRKNSSVYVINRRAAAVFMHERYSNRNYDNDLALIRLSAPVEWSERLHPVCLPTAHIDYAGETAVTTGWGAIREGGPIAQKLQEVEVPILTQVACRSSNYESTQITDNMLCAGFDEGGKDSCQGDSGGPLHVRIQESDDSHRRHLLAGVVSWGEGCARPRTPGVYTRITRYLDWIAERTRDACGCDMMEMTTEDSTTAQQQKT